MASKLWNLRLDDETRARWEAAAEDRGYPTLAEFVKACVEAEVAGDPRPRRPAARRPVETAVVLPPPTVPPPVRPPDVQPGPTAGGKRSYESDFKKEKKK